jgi:hypothetical protein
MRRDWLKFYEPYASSRREVAEMLRKLHRENPALARLAFRRFREEQQKLIDTFWNTPTGTTGLHTLLK